ncbi:MAG: hypothetical protein HY825_20365 [Acidobacteria bacterium]|nr:hypothetical protein [Acidobacteriota bacterium]
MTTEELPEHLNPNWEWEILQDSIEFEPAGSEGLPTGIEKVRVFRRESDYGLHFETTGGSAEALRPKKRQDVAEPDPILPPSPPMSGTCQKWGRSVRIDNPHFIRSTFNERDGAGLEGAAFGRFANGRGSPGFELLAREDSDPAISRSLWFATSSKFGRGWSGWPRGTEREQERTFRRRRDGTDHARERAGKPTGSSLDCALFTVEGVGSVVVAAVPKGVRPEWFQGIEVEHVLGQPSGATAIDIHPLGEALGFVFGAPVVPLGHTDLDSNGRVHSAAAWYPRHADLMRVTCEIDPSPPCRLSDWAGRQATETILQTIVPAWLRERGRLQLRTIAYLLHHADVLPIDIRLVLYMAIIETLAVAVVTSGDGKDPGNWSWRIKALAAALNLRIGEPEWQALKARHDFAHAWSPDDRSLAWHVHIEAAFRTLVHRVLLAALGYRGEYIDYSDRSDRGNDPHSMGHPTRTLAEPAAGPKGDGKPAPDE